MSYLRTASLIIAGENDALELNQLRIKFTLRQGDLSTPNTASIRVYNVSPDTAHKIEAEYTRVRLQCGYEDTQLGTRFDGDLVQVRRGRENATDTYLDLLCTDGIFAHQLSTVSQSLAAGSTDQDQYAAIIASFGRQGVGAPSTAPDLRDTTLPRGKVMYGMTRTYLDTLATNNQSRASIQQGVTTIIPDNGYLDGDVVTVNAQTGMIGIPEQTQGGIRVRVLINPFIKIGGRIQITDPINMAALGTSLNDVPNNARIPRLSDSGIYRVVIMDDTGDTRGTEWYSDLICLSTDPTAITPQSLIDRGYS